MVRLTTIQRRTPRPLPSARVAFAAILLVSMLVFASAASVGVAKGYETYQSLLRIPLLVLAGIAATLWAVSLGMAISYARIARTLRYGVAARGLLTHTPEQPLGSLRATYQGREVTQRVWSGMTFEDEFQVTYLTESFGRKHLTLKVGDEVDLLLDPKDSSHAVFVYALRMVLEDEHARA